ncbi:MAG: class I SAM-dependent methyltransferase [Pseudomonadota bacterium]
MAAAAFKDLGLSRWWQTGYPNQLSSRGILEPETSMRDIVMAAICGTCIPPIVIEASTEKFWMDMRDVIFSEDRLENADAEAEDALNRVGISEPSQVLDVGCGIGRHSWSMARRGHHVTGIDQIAGYIEEAQRPHQAADKAPKFINADLVDYKGLPFGAFDAALCLYHSLGFSADPGDDIVFLRRIRAALRPGGKLLLDLINPESFLPGERREYEETTSSGLARSVIEVAEMRDRYEIIFTPAGSPNVHYRARHRLFSARRIQELLEAAGFAGVTVGQPLIGSYENGSDRFTVIASADA